MVGMLFGHLVGDYYLQPRRMALSKSKHNGLGLMICLIHCVLYTLFVCLFMWNFTPLWIITVFVTHYIPDRYGLADKYLQLIHGRSFTEFMANPENQTYSPHVALRAGFATIVYVIIDNTMHLIPMYYLAKIIL